MKPSGRSLVLVPWHIGNLADITLNTARAARDMRIFLAEEPEATKRIFGTDLGIDCREKKFLAIPEREDEAFLKNVREMLRAEDVALICSGGIPCFLDPGAWLVRRLRALGTPVKALAGASILSTMLSLSGLEWAREQSRGTFAFYLDGPSRNDILEAVQRQDEAVFVFLGVDKFRECLEHIGPVIGARLVSAFFDLTKSSAVGFPYADQVMTMDARAWLKEAAGIRWKEVSDVALMIHPRAAKV